VDTTVRDPLEGRLLDGRYSIQSKIARGGMATVYLAIDRRLGREVALKIMHHHLADDESFTSRFVREARSAARLSHPNVVQVYDQGSDGDLLYLAMEYLPGRTLREVLIERGVLTPREALTVFEPILDALSAAHRAGIVHRDVKPENVILTDDGRVKVADFGLARGATASTATTGQLMGTVAYLAPELVTRGIADARSDVYASGIMLFEMLTGCQPFTGDVPIQVAYRHVHEQVPAPSRLVPQLPVQLDDLVLAAAANDPGRRPGSAGELLALVRQAHAALPAALLDARPPRPAPGGSVPLPPSAPLTGSADDGRTAAVPGRVGHQPTRALPGVTPRTDLPGTGPAGTGPAGTPGSGAGATSSRRAARASGRDSRTRSARSVTTADAELLDLGETRRRRGQIGLAAVLAVAVLLAVVAWWFTGGPGAFRTTPRLTGLTLAEAQRNLHVLGMRGVARPQHDDAARPGTVIASSPRSGQQVRRGGTVVLYICAGPARVTVPETAHLTEDAARAVLTRNFLKVSSDRLLEYDDKAPRGAVLSSAPPAGTQVDNGTEVTLTISRGPQPVDLPDFVGRPQQDATGQLQTLGFAPAIKQEFSDTFPAGTVISQDPAGGEGKQAFHGQTVTLTVSQGPEMAQVPNVMGKREDEARKILEEAGFRVEVNRYLGGVFETVRAQNPQGDGQAPKGSTVTITVV
jgi:beta-lactam-binding protein with PASTA domain/tRNA A-37 threonylcarbamoyl transferase component Bud32